MPMTSLSQYSLFLSKLLVKNSTKNIMKQGSTLKHHPIWGGEISAHVKDAREVSWLRLCMHERWNYNWSTVTKSMNVKLRIKWIYGFTSLQQRLSAQWNPIQSGRVPNLCAHFVYFVNGTASLDVSCARQIITIINTKYAMNPWNIEPVSLWATKRCTGRRMTLVCKYEWKVYLPFVGTFNGVVQCAVRSASRLHNLVT